MISSEESHIKLLSTQPFFFDEEGGLLSDRVEVETFDYPLDEVTQQTTNDIGTRVRTLYGYSGWCEIPISHPPPRESLPANAPQPDIQRKRRLYNAEVA